MWLSASGTSQFKSHCQFRINLISKHEYRLGHRVSFGSFHSSWAISSRGFARRLRPRKRSSRLVFKYSTMDSNTLHQLWFVFVAPIWLQHLLVCFVPLQGHCKISAPVMPPEGVAENPSWSDKWHPHQLTFVSHDKWHPRQLISISCVVPQNKSSRGSALPESVTRISNPIDRWICHAKLIEVHLSNTSCDLLHV